MQSNALNEEELSFNLNSPLTWEEQGYWSTIYIFLTVHKAPNVECFLMKKKIVRQKVKALWHWNACKDKAYYKRHCVKYFLWTPFKKSGDDPLKHIHWYHSQADLNWLEGPCKKEFSQFSSASMMIYSAQLAENAWGCTPSPFRSIYSLQLCRHFQTLPIKIS